MSRDSLQKIKSKLSQYPMIKYEEKADAITILPSSETGFPVTFNAGKNYFMVSLKGWHEEFLNEEGALNCVMFGLSDQCRLKVFSTGQFEYKWIVEYKRDTAWIDESETGFLLFPFWKKKNVKYLGLSRLPVKRTKESAPPSLY